MSVEAPLLALGDALKAVEDAVAQDETQGLDRRLMLHASPAVIREVCKAWEAKGFDASPIAGGIYLNRAGAAGVP